MHDDSQFHALLTTVRLGRRLLIPTVSVEQVNDLIKAYTDHISTCRHPQEEVEAIPTGDDDIDEMINVAEFIERRMDADVLAQFLNIPATFRAYCCGFAMLFIERELFSSASDAALRGPDVAVH